MMTPPLEVQNCLPQPTTLIPAALPALRKLPCPSDLTINDFFGFCSESVELSSERLTEFGIPNCDFLTLVLEGLMQAVKDGIK